MRRVAPFFALTNRGLALGLFAAVSLMAGAWYRPLAGGMLLLVAGLCIADIVDMAAVSQRGLLTVRRRFEPRFLQGITQTIGYAFENASDRPIGVRLSDEVDGAFVFDADHSLILLAAQARTVIMRTGRASDRGDLRFLCISLQLTSRFGFFEQRFVHECAEPARTYPYLALAASGSLTHRRLLIRHGVQRLHRRGAGSEKAGTRPYESGDPFRTIDFLSTARRGTLTVSEQEIERGEQIVIMLDSGRLMTARFEDKQIFDHALAATLSIADLARESGDHVGLHAFAETTVTQIPARTGVAHREVLRNAAVRLQPSLVESDYQGAAAAVLHAFRKRSCVVLFTNLHDPSAAQDLRAACRLLRRHHTVLCVLLNDGILDTAARQRIESDFNAFEVAVAVSLLDQRRVAVQRLRQDGNITVDAPAAAVTMPLLEAYLRVKRGSVDAVRPASVR